MAGHQSYSESYSELLQLAAFSPKVDSSVLSGGCALHYAVSEDNHEGMEALLARQDLTTINQRDYDGRTPIMYVVYCNALNCFNLLLAHPEVDLDTRDNYQRSPEEARR